MKPLNPIFERMRLHSKQFIFALMGVLLFMPSQAQELPFNSGEVIRKAIELHNKGEYKEAIEHFLTVEKKRHQLQLDAGRNLFKLPRRQQLQGSHSNLQYRTSSQHRQHRSVLQTSRELHLIAVEIINRHSKFLRKLLSVAQRAIYLGTIKELPMRMRASTKRPLKSTSPF